MIYQGSIFPWKQIMFKFDFFEVIFTVSAEYNYCNHTTVILYKLFFSAGHRKFFFLSPQSANPQTNFNLFNPQPQVRNCTFKKKLSPQLQVCNDFSRFLNPQPQVRKRTASPQLFMNRVKKLCNQPRPEVNCS